MFALIKSKIGSRLQTIGQRSAAAVCAYIVGLSLHILINLCMHRAMANEGLAFWQASGTVIAAVIASVYGSSYAFELSRQKDAAAERRSNQEAGKWALIVIASHVNYLIDLTKCIYGEMTKPNWQLLMESILYAEVVPAPPLSELRFLVHQGKDSINYLIDAATDFSVIRAVSLNADRNELKDRSKKKMDAYLDLHPEELKKEFKGANGWDEYHTYIVQIISEPLALQISLKSDQLLHSCELGVKATVGLYDGLLKLLRNEFPELDFKELDKVAMENRLGKKLWD